MSTGWSYHLRKVDCRNGLNGGTWRVVVDGGRGSDDGLCGGNPLWVVDCLDDVSWHEVCETRWWWVQWVKMMAAVVVTVPGGSCGGAGSQEVMW